MSFGLPAILIFVVSLLVSAVLVRWSTRKALGIKLSFKRSIWLVLARTVVALIGGFALGNALRLANQEGLVEQKGVQIIVFCVIGMFSFLVYYFILGKISGQPVPLAGFAKSVGLETGTFMLLLIAFSFVVSTLLHLAGLY